MSSKHLNDEEILKLAEESLFKADNSELMLLQQAGFLLNSIALSLLVIAKNVSVEHANIEYAKKKGKS